MSHANSTHLSTLQWLVLKFETWIAATDSEPVTGIPTSNDQEDFESELIQRLEGGYIAEDTGRFVTVPDFIARQIKARLETDDWC